MAPIRWEPAAEINSIQNEMNRLFNSFFDRPAATSGGEGAMRRWIPAMDLVETGDHYVLRADLPGLSERDVEIQLEDNVLTISGERRTKVDPEQEECHRLERAFGAFSRSLTLPEGTDPDGVRAHFDRGVLEVTVAKPEQRKPRRVQISVGERGDAGAIEGTATAEETNNGRDPVTAATT